jgi:hypothetical protein
MKETAFGVHRFTRRLSGRFALGALVVFAASVGQASDIGGEVGPPPCAYDSSGRVVSGFPPQCAGLAGVSVLSTSGSVLTNLSFSATAGTVAQPFRWDDAVSGSQSDLLFSGTLGPLLPLPSNPQLEGNALGGRQFFSRMMSETVVNDSTSAWAGFYIELQSVLGTPSTNDDGLSFGQISRNPQQLVILPNSDIFSTVDFEANLRDSVTFSEGHVAPGQSVVLNFPVSETTALSGFYLLQRPVETPEPVSFLLAVSAVALLVCRRRVVTAGAGSETGDRVAVPRISARR